VVALIAALAGTAVAGPGASTSAKAVTKAKVKKIANKQINKQFPLTAEDLGPGIVTSSKLGTINTRSVDVTLGPDAFGEGTANCLTGEKLISGGVQVNNQNIDEFTSILESYKDGEGWYARFFNDVGTRTFTVYAYCLSV
jgi:hypothetical protein